MDAVYSHITFNYEKSFTLHYVYWLYVNTVDNIRWEKKSVQKSEKTLSVLHFKHRWFQQRVQLLEEIWIIPNKVNCLWSASTLIITHQLTSDTHALKWTVHWEPVDWPHPLHHTSPWGSLVGAENRGGVAWHRNGEMTGLFYTAYWTATKGNR